jgi:hypothetical protein
VPQNKIEIVDGDNVTCNTAHAVCLEDIWVEQCKHYRVSRPHVQLLYAPTNGLVLSAASVISHKVALVTLAIAPRCSAHYSVRHNFLLANLSLSCTRPSMADKSGSSLPPRFKANTAHGSPRCTRADSLDIFHVRYQVTVTNRSLCG